MKKIMILLFLIPVLHLSASTIIINSIYNKDINPEAATAAAAVEDGLMESLFDYGFIMFSTVNSKTYQVEGAKDARYMISIEPLIEDDCVSFKIQATINGMIIDSGIIDSGNISDESGFDSGKFYYLLGEEVAEQLMKFL